MRTWWVLFLAMGLPSARADEVVRYQGKTAREWVEAIGKTIGSGRDDYEPLWRMGPAAVDALPALIKKIEIATKGSDDLTRGVESGIAFYPGVFATMGSRAVPTLQETLRHQQPAMRRIAVVALANIEPRPAGLVDSLAAMLKDDDETVRLVAARKLREAGQPPEKYVPVLIELVRAKRLWTRQEAVRELELLGPRAKDAIPALIEALGDIELEWRVHGSYREFPKGSLSRASIALHAIGADAVPALRSAVAAKDPRVRRHALVVLQKLSVPIADLTSLLQARLTDSDATVRLVAAMHYWRITGEGKKAVPVLLEILRSNNSELQEVAAHVLASIGQPAGEAIPVLVEYLAKGNTWFADESLARFGSEAIPALIRLLENERFMSRAAGILASIGTAAEAAVLRELASKNVQARIRAARVFSEWHHASPRLIVALHDARKDIDARVRFFALVGLARLDLSGNGDDIAFELGEFLRAKNFPYRSEAATALAGMWRRARKGLPALCEAAKDEHLRPEVMPTVALLAPDNPDAIAWVLGEIDVGGIYSFLWSDQITPHLLPHLKKRLQARAEWGDDAIHALGVLASQSPEAVNLLIEGLENKGQHPRSYAEVVAIHHIDTKNPRLRKALLGRSKELVETCDPRALQVLSELGAEGQEAIRKELKNADVSGFGVFGALQGPWAALFTPELIDSLKKCAPEEKIDRLEVILDNTGKLQFIETILLEMLKGPDVYYSRSAARLLSEVILQQPQVVPHLVKYLQSNNSYTPPLPVRRVNRWDRMPDGSAMMLDGPIIVMHGFIGALANIDLAPPESWSPYRGGLSMTRGSGVKEWESSPTARAGIRGLMSLLASEQRANRIWSATMLGKIGKPARAAVPALRKLLADKNHDVRAAAALAMCRIDAGSVETIPILCDALKENMRNYGTPGESAEALARIGKPAVPHLIAMLRESLEMTGLNDGFGWTQGREVEILAGQAAWALAEIGEDAVEALPAMLKALEWAMTKPDVVPYYLRSDFRLYQSPIRASVLHYLGKLGAQAKEALPLLHRLVADPKEVMEARLGAAELIWRLEGKSGPAVLLIRDYFERFSHLPARLASWLVELGPDARELAPSLGRLLAVRGYDLNDPSNRVEAARILGRLGAHAREAVPALKAALRDSQPEVRAAAGEALKRIGD